MDDRVKDEVARRLRSTRRAQVAVAAAALLVVGSAFFLYDGDPPLPTTQVLTQSSPTPSASPCTGFPGSCPDAAPGWSGGFTGCHPATAPVGTGTTVQVVEGVTATMSVPQAAVAGSTVDVTLVLQNNRAEPYAFSLSAGFGDPVSAFGPAGASAVHTTDTGGAGQDTLRPGASLTQTYPLKLVTCGDTMDDTEPPLGDGSYEVGLTVRIDDQVVELAGRLELT